MKLAKTNKKQLVVKTFGTKPMFSKLKAKVNSDEDELEQINESQCGYFMETKALTRLVVPIDSSFKDASHYRMVVNKISELGEGDLIEFHVHSDGGSLDGLVALLTAIKTTEAETMAVIQGSCHSAASILSLNCDSVKLSPYSTMLVHSVRFGMGVSKGYDIASQVEHTNKHAAAIFREAYEHFLSEAEIDAVLFGREMWLDFDEIDRRLTLKYEILNELESENDDEQNCCGDPYNCPDICACPNAEDYSDEDNTDEYVED